VIAYSERSFKRLSPSSAVLASPELTQMHLPEIASVAARLLTIPTPLRCRITAPEFPVSAVHPDEEAVCLHRNRVFPQNSPRVYAK